MPKQSKSAITDEMIEALEAEIIEALVERLPELRQYAVNPQAVTYFERGAPFEAWVVARSGQAVLFVGVEPERFGVGLFGADRELENISFYPTPELAVPALVAAGAHDI